MFASLALSIFAALLLTLPAQRAIELLVPVTGAVAGFVYFLYSQQLQQTRLFLELFRAFNERYDRLNDKLNVIVSQAPSPMFSAEQKQVLFDYFNLCAEEWMYFRAGYIDPDAWEAWRRGMKFFLSSPGVRKLWVEELKGGSYYGFSIEIVEQ
jgi:hypothetical protein